MKMWVRLCDPRSLVGQTVTAVVDAGDALVIAAGGKLLVLTGSYGHGFSISDTLPELTPEQWATLSKGRE